MVLGLGWPLFGRVEAERFRISWPPDDNGYICIVGERTTSAWGADSEGVDLGRHASVHASVHASATRAAIFGNTCSLSLSNKNNAY